MIYKKKEKWGKENPQSIEFHNTTSIPCIFYVYSFPFDKYPSGSGVPSNPRPHIGDMDNNQQNIILGPITLQPGESSTHDYGFNMPYSTFIFQVRPAEPSWKNVMSSNYNPGMTYYDSYRIFSVPNIDYSGKENISDPAIRVESYRRDW